MLRRQLQCWETNLNIRKVGVLPKLKLTSYDSNVYKSLVRKNGQLWRRANARNVRPRFLYRQYTNLFKFRFVSLHSLRSTLRFMFLSDEGPTFKTLDFTFYIGSTPTFLYFDLYLNIAYAGHKILYFSLTKVLRLKG